MKKETKKVLIAEDDKFIAEMYVTKLISEGYDAISVENGQQALDEMRKNKPDMVLLDIFMPLMNGTDVLKNMKQDKGLEDIPVIILTNANEKDYVDIALDSGARDYLVKSSHTPDEVVIKIKENL